MGRSKIGLHFKGWEEMVAKLDKLAGTESVKCGVESALKYSKKYVTYQIEKSLEKLPANGKYSTGRTKNSIDKEMKVYWNGGLAEIKIGFCFKKSGLTGIFLMYGTPRTKPVIGLKTAIYGEKTKKEIKKLQVEEINKVIKKIMERS